MAIVDAVTGMYATIAIMAALEHRHASGRGQYIDLGLLDCAVALNSYHAVNYFLPGSAPASSSCSAMCEPTRLKPPVTR